MESYKNSVKAHNTVQKSCNMTIRANYKRVSENTILVYDFDTWHEELGNLFEIFCTSM